jgi:hypothetical protein
MPPGPSADVAFWNDKKLMKPYDITLLPAECYPEHQPANPTVARQQMADYLNEGGRVLAGNFQVAWMRDSPDPGLRSVATFRNPLESGAGGTHYVVTKLPNGAPFPKGEALAEWILETSASASAIPRPLGQFETQDDRASVLTLNPAVAQAWITAPATMWETRPGPRYFSVPTPVGALDSAICGELVFADQMYMWGHANPFPSACGPLKGDKKLFEYMLFELSSCLQSNAKSPAVPK